MPPFPFRVFHYSVTQLLLTTTLFACVHLEAVKVAVVAVWKGPHLDASLHRLHRHVLLQGGATCKLDHCFLNGYLFVWLVEV